MEPLYELSAKLSAGSITGKLSENELSAKLEQSGELAAELSGAEGLAAKLSDTSLSADLQVSKSSFEAYTGPYTATPKLAEETILATNGYVMRDNLTVFEIPYAENPTSGTDGKTIYLCSEVE